MSLASHALEGELFTTNVAWEAHMKLQLILIYDSKLAKCPRSMNLTFIPHAWKLC